MPTKRKPYVKYTREILEPLVMRNASVAGVMRDLGFKILLGGSHTNISRAIRRFGKKRRVDRPTLEQLQADLALMPYTKVGKKYGVSDNAVRKWLKAYADVAQRQEANGLGPFQ